MKILILGAGAIGSLFGGFLAKAEHDVYFLGRLKNTAAIKKNGLKIDGIWGEHRIKNIHCFESLKQIKTQCTQEFDYVIVSVKSYDTEMIITEFVNLFPEPAPILSLQNGLGNIDILNKIVGSTRTIGGRVITGVEYLTPGHIRVTVSASEPVLGAISSSANSKAVSAAEMFTDAGIKTAVTENIHTFIWEKVLYNSALNALSTILDINYGQLVSSTSSKELILCLILEIFEVMEKEQVTVGFKNAEDYTNHLFDVLIPKTFEHHPSMLQDINHGKRTEIDALNGAIARLSEKHGLSSPYNQTITRIIKSKEQL